MGSVNNSLIGAIRAEATLESGKFVEGAKKIAVVSKQTETQLKTSFGGMAGAIKGFGAALAGGLSIGLLTNVIKKSIDFATTIKDVAQQVNVTTTELQNFRYAASQMGATQAQADKALENLNLTLGQAAAGSKAAKNALDAVGVSLQDVANKSNIEIFKQIADQMLAQGGAAKNAAAGNVIFKESFADLIPLFDQGSKGLDELTAANERLGGVLSEEQIRRFDETARKLDDVRRVLSVQIADVVGENTNAIIALANALVQVVAIAGKAVSAIAAIGDQVSKVPNLPQWMMAFLPGANIGAGIGFAINAATSKKLGPSATVTLPPARARRGRTAVPQFLASGGGARSRRGRTPRAPRDRSDDVTFQFDQELRRAQIDVLRAQQSLARTSADRADIAMKLLDAERQMQEAELQDRVRRAERDFAEGKITAGALEQAKVQAEKLRAEYASVEALERQAIADDLAADQARDAQELSDSAYDLRLEQLELEASLAETAGERREAELRILDLMKQQEKARLDAVIADQQSSELAKQQAQQRLNELNNIYAGRAAVVRQGTRGPMESFQAEFGDISEEMEQLKVQGIMGATDALVELTKGWDSFRDAALSAIQQVLAELIRLQLMKMAVNFISGGMGGGFDAGGFSSIVSSNASALGAIPMNIPGFASGGGFRVRGVPGVDRNILSINGIPQARVSHMEHVNVSNDNADGFGHMGPLIGNITLPPGMTPREGRETGLAIGRALQDRLGYTVTGRKR